MAPQDRRAYRPLPFGRRPRATGQDGETLLEPLEQERELEHLHTGCSQLDRERQTIEAPADLDNLTVRGEIGANGGRPLQEERHRLSLAQRIDGELPLT